MAMRVSNLSSQQPLKWGSSACECAKVAEKAITAKSVIPIICREVRGWSEWRVSKLVAQPNSIPQEPTDFLIYLTAAMHQQATLIVGR